MNKHAEHPGFHFTIPNVISSVRLVASPLLLVAGKRGEANGFILLLALFLITDLADGMLARLLNQRSKLGASLDTWGDIFMFFSMTGGWYLLWPESFFREGLSIVFAIGSIGLSGLVSLLKHHRLPAYHTWTAKISSATVGIGALLMFAEVTPWLFRCAVAVLAVSAAEETFITLLLPKWQPDIHSLHRAVQIRRQANIRF